MSSALFTALSGLQAHQSWMDVIGNNLANASTSGYKSSNATFAGHFSQTLAAATGPGAGRGGRNPVQIGLGVRLADTARDFSQGALATTGRTFDVALQGRGFFTVSNGLANLYTRVGTFGLDASRFLVDQRTGYQVLGRSGSAIQLDTDSLLPPRATTSGSIVGNLPKVVSGPLPEVLTAASPLTEGSPATLSSSNSGPYAIPIGETWTMRVSVSGGAPQTASVTSTTGTVTADEIADAIDALDGVGAAVSGTGGIDIQTDRTGEDVSLVVTPGAANQDLAALVGISTVLVRGSEADVSDTTELNALPANAIDYADGDQIHVTGVDADGSAVNAVFTFGATNDGTTVGELVTYLDGLFAGSTVSLDSSGRIVVESDTAGEAGLQLSMLDDAAATGRTEWATHALSVTTQGTPPDEVTSAMEVFDAAGVAHAVTMTYARQADGSWTISASIPESEGAVLSPPITGLEFDDAGAPIGLSAVNSTISFSFAGQSAPQEVTLDFGEDGAFTGITQFGADGAVTVHDQDGYGVGELSALDVDADGRIMGLYTNGETLELGALGIATFVNPEGLTQVGDTMYARSTNSGVATIGAGNTGGAGRVMGGALESSNVDTAEQFVRLIEAQRGFQANARVITAQNEVLRDIVNLV
ncbi:MAG: flagellar hook protein FlgE [Planctomycetota bacterium]